MLPVIVFVVSNALVIFVMYITFEPPVELVATATSPVAPDPACVSVSPATTFKFPVVFKIASTSNAFAGCVISSYNAIASGISFGSLPSATRPNSP